MSYNKVLVAVDVATESNYVVEKARDVAGAALKGLGDAFEVDADHQYLERGHAPTQILRLAKDTGADLIVVGSHGRHGLRLLLGSTANAVLHGAECDVLAVRVEG